MQSIREFEVGAIAASIDMGAGVIGSGGGVIGSASSGSRVASRARALSLPLILAMPGADAGAITAASAPLRSMADMPPLVPQPARHRHLRNYRRRHRARPLPPSALAEPASAPDATFIDSLDYEADCDDNVDVNPSLRPAITTTTTNNAINSSTIRTRGSSPIHGNNPFITTRPSFRRGLDGTQISPPVIIDPAWDMSNIYFHDNSDDEDEEEDIDDFEDEDNTGDDACAAVSATDEGCDVQSPRHPLAFMQEPTPSLLHRAAKQVCFDAVPRILSIQQPQANKIHQIEQQQQPPPPQQPQQDKNSRRQRRDSAAWIAGFVARVRQAFP